MSKDQIKKKEELHFFQEFCALHLLEQIVGIDQPVPPEPDIVFELNHQTIGVEVTKYFVPDNSIKKKENEQEQIVNRARQIYETYQLPPVCVRIYWDEFISINKQDRAYLANTIANLVATTVPELGGQIKIEYDAELTCPLPELITEIIIDRLVDYKSNHWHVPRAAFIPHCSAKEIQNIIDKKDCIYKDYKGKCDLLWLLIVSESRGPSSWVELPPAIVQNQFVSKFNATYFLNRSQNRLFKLNLLSKNT